ncbi:hypothetical protein C3L33_00786, partial [Rhododendron williamsianum]
MLLDERRMALMLKVGPRKPPHMAGLGDPGTALEESMSVMDDGKVVIFAGYTEPMKHVITCNEAFCTMKGMTPLHLAVWHSLQSEDCSTVKTLLEYNADCSAGDNVLLVAILKNVNAREEPRALIARMLKNELATHRMKLG